MTRILDLVFAAVQTYSARLVAAVQAYGIDASLLTLFGVLALGSTLYACVMIRWGMRRGG